MKKQITPLIYLFTIILLSQVIIAPEPSLSYSKIYLSPFYQSGLIANTNYSYRVSVSPPDGLSQVLNSIITFQTYISPSLNFSIWINGQSCNTPSFYISTTYAGAGQGDITFDCNNIINHIGDYNVTVRTSKNTGAITSWLDLTYINNPKGEMTIHGTEYTFGQMSKAWLQLINTSGNVVNNAVCYVDIYYPDQSEFIERAVMTNANHDGIYYYDFKLPDIEGVYPVIALCYYEAGTTPNYATNFTIINGTIDSGALSDTYIQDASYYTTSESPVGLGNPRRYLSELTFNNATCSNISSLLLTGIGISWVGRWNSNAGGDYMSISIYNYTSATWISLPNTITGSGTGVKSVSNSIALNNITSAGLTNSTGKGLKIRFQDTNLSDTSSSGFDYDYFSVDCQQLSNPTWQQIQGSSEIHLSNPLRYQFVPETLCNGEKPTSSDCSYFEEDINYFPEGVIIENITITNTLGQEIDDVFYYDTPSVIDCTAINSITFIDENLTETDITNTTIYSLGTKENCELAIPIHINYEEQNAKITIRMDNYMVWETIRTNDLVVAYRDVLDGYCDAIANQYNFTYEVPLANSVINLTNISSLIGCSRVKDDLYWYYNYLNQSYECLTSGCYESLFFEINRWYFPALYQQFEVIQTILRNNNQLLILANINLTDSRLINFTISTNQTLQQILYEMTQISINQTGINLTEITDYLTSMNNNITINLGDIQNQLTSISNQENITFAEIHSINQTINQNIMNTQNLIMSLNQTMINQFNITNNKIDNLELDLTNQLINLQANLSSQMNEIMNYLIIINQTTIETRNLAQQIWDYITSWLNGTINQIEYKLDILLNASNLTITPISITQNNNAPCITGSNWIIDARVTGNYGQILDNTTVACNITTDFTNNTMMSYQPEGYFEYRMICPSPALWNWTIDCEPI